MKFQVLSVYSKENEEQFYCVQDVYMSSIYIYIFYSTENCNRNYILQFTQISRLRENTSFDAIICACVTEKRCYGNNVFTFKCPFHFQTTTQHDSISIVQTPYIFKPNPFFTELNNSRKSKVCKIKICTKFTIEQHFQAYIKIVVDWYLSILMVVRNNVGQNNFVNSFIVQFIFVVTTQFVLSFSIFGVADCCQLAWRSQCGNKLPCWI